MATTAVQDAARDYLDQLQRALDTIPLEAVEAVVERLFAAVHDGRQVLIVGNGGSAATASHMACDLAKNLFGQFPTATEQRGRFKVLALTDNMPIITAWANDAGYERVFVEQVRTFIEPNDVLIAISGSGNSANVVAAVREARRRGASTIGLLGFAGGALKDLVDLALVVGSNQFGPIEDAHGVLNHMILVCLRERLASAAADGAPASA